MLNPAVSRRSDSLRPWAVGALCKAIADALEARFNPVAVSGEISGFTRAASGHCYFTLKDDAGQLRCAMFRRAASALAFAPRDGDKVEVRGRLGVYEPRGELQLVVETMSRAGAGSLFEEFLQRKARLEQQGLFDAERKRALAELPRGLGLVTSLGAAALHDVMTALQRRVPHVPVVLAPASVQGEGAPVELVAALNALYAMAKDPSAALRIDTILLVRGGGSLEDLWAFNDEALALTIAQSPVPVVCGVGHETDLTIADFVADVRAPTPTAAAELAAIPRTVLLDELQACQAQLARATQRHMERQQQTLDRWAMQIGRPSALVQRQAGALSLLAHRLQQTSTQAVAQRVLQLNERAGHLAKGISRHLERHDHALEGFGLRLRALDPHQVLQRGYAWLNDEDGRALTRSADFAPGQRVRATLADGAVDLNVAVGAGE